MPFQDIELKAAPAAQDVRPFFRPISQHSRGETRRLVNKHAQGLLRPHSRTRTTHYIPFKFAYVCIELVGHQVVDFRINYSSGLYVVGGKSRVLYGKPRNPTVAELVGLPHAPGATLELLMLTAIEACAGAVEFPAT